MYNCFIASALLMWDLFSRCVWRWQRLAGISIDEPSWLLLLKTPVLSHTHITCVLVIHNKESLSRWCVECYFGRTSLLDRARFVSLAWHSVGRTQTEAAFVGNWKCVAQCPRKVVWRSDREWCSVWVAARTGCKRWFWCWCNCMVDGWERKLRIGSRKD